MLFFEVHLIFLILFFFTNLRDELFFTEVIAPQMTFVAPEIKSSQSSLYAG